MPTPLMVRSISAPVRDADNADRPAPSPKLSLSLGRTLRRTTSLLRRCLVGRDRRAGRLPTATRPDRRFRLTLAACSMVGFVVLEGAHPLGLDAETPPAPICRVETRHNTVALTFDDGPDPRSTPAVLALLDRYDYQATFFLLGARAARFPELVDNEKKAGMEIGNHTWSHPRIPSQSMAQVRREVAATDRVLGRKGVSRLFRAPYGEVTPGQLAILQRDGLTPIHWSVALDHYVGGKGLAPTEAAARIISDVRPGDIILVHDVGLLPQHGRRERASAMAALRLVLPGLARRGFRVTTVSTLLSQGSPVIAKPSIGFWRRGFSCPH